MRKEEVEAAYKRGEGQDAEFKASVSLKREIGETVSAFSNSNDGIILIGVQDSKDIIGVKIGKGTLGDLADFIKMNTDPKIYPAWIEAHQLENKTIIAVKIKESVVKPVWYNDRVFKREGNTNQRVSRTEIKKLLREETKAWLFDEQICEDASLEDINEAKVRIYLDKKAKGIKPEDMDFETLLLNIHAARERNDVTKPTNAGILFFGNNPQRYILQSQVRVARFDGETLTGDILDHLDTSGTLWEMVEQAEEFIKRNVRPLEFRTPVTFERVRLEYPMKVIREGVINAIIHRDYREHSDTSVLIFDDRIEIINPGTFPEGTTPEAPKHIPINPVLCQLMYEFGYVEKYGSGILMMQQACREEGIPEPEYELSKRVTKLIFHLPKVWVSISAVEKAGIKLNERQKKALKHAFIKGSITNREYRAAYNISQKTAFLELFDMVNKGILTPEGKGRAVRYVPKM